MIKKAIAKWKDMPVMVKTSVAYTACSVLQRSISFITLPLFTRLLTTAQYGQYNVYSSWSMILTIFISLNLAYGSFSTAMVQFEDQRREYIASIQNLVLALGLVFLAVYLPFSGMWNKLLNMPTALVILMIAEIVTQFALSCWYRIKQFTYQYIGVIVLTLAVSAAMPLCAYFLVVHSAEKGFARIFGYALVTIIVGGVLFIYNAVRGKGGFRKNFFKYALTFNIPLIPYYLSQVIFNQSDRIMIDHMCGKAEAGIYGVAYSLATMLTFVINAINNSYVPWFYGRIKQGKERENRNIVTGIAGLMAFLLLGIIALAPEIIGIMAGSDYKQAVWIVPPVAMSILLLFYSQLFINVEFYFKEKMLLVWGSVGSALLNVLLNWWLIPIYGFVAAGYTTLVSYVVFALANYLTMLRLVKKENFSTEAYDIRAMVWLFVGFAALSFASMALYRYPIIRYAIIVIVLGAVAIKHKLVADFVKKTLIRKK